MKQLRIAALLLLVASLMAGARARSEPGRGAERRLYVATPGIRNYQEYGGVGLLVYDMDHGHRLIKRIPTFAARPGQEPEAVKGVCASARTARLYLSTPTRLLCLDLVTEQPLWERTYEGGCDRMSMTPDGKAIYLPSLEGPHWTVVDAASGDVTTRIQLGSGSHNTIVGPSGAWAYLAGLKSPLLSIADTRSNRVMKTAGPFGNVIRPFTVNGSETLCFVNVNELLGFEVGDLRTGKPLHRVTVSGFEMGPTKRHGCPSHGIGLTPDERELWLCDAHNSRLHVFDATRMPPVQVASIALRDQPGWITFSIDGRTVYPSTGEVIDPPTRRILTALQDETGRPVHSEKMVEIDFADGKPARAGDQFGIGQRGGATE